MSIQLKNGKMDNYKEVKSVESDSEYITITEKNRFDETVFYRRKMDDIKEYAVVKC